MGFPAAFSAANAAASSLNLLTSGIGNNVIQGQNPFNNSRRPFDAAQQMQRGINSDQQALYGAQQDLAISEAGRDANQRADEVRHFREEQANKYNGSGVLLSGSPLIVLEYTRQKGQQEINAIVNRGHATADLLRRQALIAQQQNSAALFGQELGYNTSQNQAEQDYLTQQALAQTGNLQANAARIPAAFNGLAGLISSLYGWQKAPKKTPSNDPLTPYPIPPPSGAAPVPIHGPRPSRTEPLNKYDPSRLPYYGPAAGSGDTLDD